MTRHPALRRRLRHRSRSLTGPLVAPSGQCLWCFPPAIPPWCEHVSRRLDPETCPSAQSVGPPRLRSYGIVRAVGSAAAARAPIVEDLVVLLAGAAVTVAMQRSGQSRFCTLTSAREGPPPPPNCLTPSRLAYGILTREGMRASELAALRWRDLDLDHGRVRLDENKTDDPRAWALSPDVVRTLRVVEEEDEGRERRPRAARRPPARGTVSAW